MDDVAEPVARAPLAPAAYQQVFNVGADQPYTVLELAHEVARAFRAEPTIRHLDARREAVHAYASHVKAHSVFGHSNPIGLAEGIARMAVWVRERGPMTPVEFSNIEVRKNLPASWAAAAQ